MGWWAKGDKRLINQSVNQNQGKLRVIRKEGGSRVLTITNEVPKEWHYVTVEVYKEFQETIILKIIKVA